MNYQRKKVWQYCNFDNIFQKRCPKLNYFFELFPNSDYLYSWLFLKFREGGHWYQTGRGAFGTKPAVGRGHYEPLSFLQITKGETPSNSQKRALFHLKTMGGMGMDPPAPVSEVEGMGLDPPTEGWDCPHRWMGLLPSTGGWEGNARYCGVLLDKIWRKKG